MERDRQLDQLPLSSSLARKMLRESFYHSQKEPGLQYDLLQAVHLLRPDWRVTSEVYQGLFSLEFDVGFLVEKGIHVPVSKGDITSETEYHSEEMRRIFNNQERITEPVDSVDILRGIARGLIERDYHYLCEQNGRPRRRVKHQLHYDPRKDRYLSHTCYYVLDGKTAGIDIFDEIFQAVRSFMQSSSEEELGGKIGGASLMQLSQVVQVYNRKHPGHRVSLPIQ